MEHIIVGNGATEMISLTMQLLRPKHALLLSPTYSEYTREIDLVGGHVEEYFLREDLDFKLDLNDLISNLPMILIFLRSVTQTTRRPAL